MTDLLMAVNPDATQKIVAACALLVGAVVVLALAVWYYRKRYILDDRPSGGQMWTFEDLRQMKDRGELTEGEYQALRASLVASFGHSGSPKATSGRTQGESLDLTQDFDLEKGRQA